MPSPLQTTRRFPFLADFSARDRAQADRASKSLAGRQRKADDARGVKATDIVAGAGRQLHDLLGPEGVAELRRAMEQERLTFRALFEPPEGLDLDRDKANQARKRRINPVLKRVGTSPKELREIGANVQAQLDEVLGTPEGQVTQGFNLARNLDRWVALSDLHGVALPWGVAPPDRDPKDPHRWFLFTPPFFGFDFKFRPQASDNFVVDREHLLDPRAGLVGNVATMDCSDAGDFDYASATVDSLVAFGFEPPVAGLLQVLVDARSNVGTHDLRTENEWGWSDHWTNQNNYLMMNVLHPNTPEPSLALMSNFYLRTDDDTNKHVENLTSGQHYYAVLTTAQPVPAGRSVVVEVGTRTFDITRANDVAVHSRTDFQWSISSVEVRIAP